MKAHAAHTSTIGTGAAGGPMDPWALPDVAARRSLTFHLAYGGALVALVIGAVNVVLGWYILRPVALMRQRLTGLQRGQWRGPVDSGEIPTTSPPALFVATTTSCGTPGQAPVSRQQPLAAMA